MWAHPRKAIAIFHYVNNTVFMEPTHARTSYSFFSFFIFIETHAALCFYIINLFNIIILPPFIFSGSAGRHRTTSSWCKIFCGLSSCTPWFCVSLFQSLGFCFFCFSSLFCQLVCLLLFFSLFLFFLFSSLCAFFLCFSFSSAFFLSSFSLMAFKHSSLVKTLAVVMARVFMVFTFGVSCCRMVSNSVELLCCSISFSGNWLEAEWMA